MRGLYHTILWDSDGWGCCPGSRGKLPGLAVAGQMFNSEGWNVVIGYSECTDATKQKSPTDYGAPGPYGSCC